MREAIIRLLWSEDGTNHAHCRCRLVCPSCHTGLLARVLRRRGIGRRLCARLEARRLRFLRGRSVREVPTWTARSTAAGSFSHGDLHGRALCGRQEARPLGPLRRGRARRALCGRPRCTATGRSPSGRERPRRALVDGKKHGDCSFASRTGPYRKGPMWTARTTAAAYATRTGPYFGNHLGGWRARVLAPATTRLPS